ncbi:MAG: adenylate/guanylate cyclase domain-containing protein [Cyanobium sp.]|nr:adenylate/guanylate cyclase domain-containing protein [Cyanobium sp.]
MTNLPECGSCGHADWQGAQESLCCFHSRVEDSQHPPREIHHPVTLKEAATLDSKTKTILFMDVKGWSKLTSSEIEAYASKGLRNLSTHLSGHDFINTWGDAIVATFDSARKAAENAIRIRDFFANSYPDSGVARGLSCRISLHLGEVIVCHNALIGREDIFGSAVHLAARLEPVTTPGQIFCTLVVANSLKDIEDSSPRALPLGQMELAKKFGTEEIFVVTGPNAPDPRPLLRQAAVGSPTEPPAESSPEGKTNLPDDSALLRLRGWLNQLPLRRSGEAIALNTIASECAVEADQPYRLLPQLIGEAGSRWAIEQLSPHDVILTYSSRRDQAAEPWVTSR